MSSKLEIILSGATGRVGLEIIKIVSLKKDLILAAEISSKSEGWESINLKKKKNIVVIDFSLPDGLESAMKWCEKNKVPLVSGTTGISNVHKLKLQKLAKKIPVLWSANMSPGISVLKKLILSFPELKEYEVQLVEKHHKHKKDSPSGTALELENVIDRSKLSKSKRNKTISIRGGGIPGEHRLLVMGEGEVIELTHHALNRSIFAEGAIRAAYWLIKQEPGLYTLEDTI